MAECSYSRCVQERRNIRRELQKWTKNMVYIVGLERVAEELMGRRKWKLYQESLTKSSSSAPLANNFSNNNNQQLEQTITNNNIISPPSFATTTTKTFIAAAATLNNNHTIKVEESDDIENEERQQKVTPANDEEENTNINNTSSKLEERLRLPPSDTHNANVVTTCTSSGEIIQVRDWSPSEKCLFCVDGKLDSRDSETPSLLPGSALSPQESDSETSDNSHSDTETPPHPNLPTLAQTLSPHLLHNNNNPNMATIESVHSMAVSLAAVAALTNNNTLGTNPPLSFYPPGFLPPWYFNNLRNFNQDQPQQSSHTPIRRLDIDVASQEKLPSASQTPTPSSEQPLDLSSKSSSTTSTTSACSTTSNNSTNSTTPISGIVQSQIDPSKIPRIPPTTMDTKHIFKAKPRMSTVTGRRTYTEDELQAALRDIQSGKLGTRRAAVIYGIPRSTLRNKVYKLAMERERENHLVLPTAPIVKLEDEEAADEEKELSGAEEEKEVEKVLQKPLLSMDDILRFSNLESHTSDSLRHLLQKTNKESQDILGGLDHSSLGPVIQSLLLRASSSVISGQKTDESAMKLPEMVQKMLAEDQSLTSEQLLHSDAINNGTNERSLSRQSSTNSVIIRNDKIPPRKSGTPEVVDNETNDSSTHPQTTSDSPSNVILKIPSFKPTTSKNGSDLFRQSPNVIDPTQNSLNITPPIGGGNESSSSPTLISKGIMSLKDVIAKSISQKFQQSSPNEQIGLKMATSPVIDVDFNSLKRGRFTPPMSNISVIKNHQDIQPNRPYPQPPKPQNNATSSSATGGKGTRPKRGKYRNYDRDSLVEAVRAVQRGEMSVHRAGSYYGVPHSTLEYKVKERHLMRPRKRDPKPQPPDDKTTPPKSQEQIRNINDKNKAPSGVKPPTQKFSPTSPNGLKMPLFDPSIPPIGYNHPPFPFWAHPTFHPMSIPSTSGFPPHPDLFATQMMQRLQDNVQNVGSSPQSTTVTNPAIGNSSAREIAESLYDGSGANGNFLDGIIRSSLEMGIPGSSNKGPNEDKNITPENMSNKALLDQLCRNSRLTPLPKPNLLDPHSSGDESSSYHSKRTQSPINFSKDFPDTKINDNVPINFSGSKSPKLDDRFSSKRNSSDIVELSNDSNESHISERKRKLSMDNQSEGDRSTTTSPSPTSRIYVKPQFQEITKPENLKPEILVRTYARLHENLSECTGTDHIVTDHNGIKETAENIESASAKPEAGQD